MKKAKAFLLGGTCLATAGLSYGACCLACELLFNRNMVPPAELSQKISGCDNSHLGEYLQNNLNWVEAYGYEKHSIISSRGQKLVGYLMRPEKESDIYVFGAHGYRSYGKKEFCAVSQYYLQKGYNVFLVDHVASGESEGAYCTFGHYEAEDCIKWLYYMNDTFGESIRIILHGVSMGSATVMMMSERKELPSNVKAIVADCGFTTARELFKYKLGKIIDIPNNKLITAVNFANKKRLGFDFDALCPVESVKKARLPMLFIHGNKDALVPCYMATELYEACASEKKDILIVDGADHAQSYMIGNEIYKDKMDSFLTDVI